MKSNYIRAGGAESRQMFREIAKEEIKKQKREFCPGCEEQIQTQVVALLCRVLHDRFGFGQKRLTELLQLARGLALRDALYLFLCRWQGMNIQHW